MIRTYVDASVLIEAFRGKGAAARRAMELLDDDNRTFIVSDFLRLEVVPKPTFHRYSDELAFMNEFLACARENIPASPHITSRAIEVASQYDTAPMDSLHIATAAVAQADELVTLEKPASPICQVREIKVVSLRQY
jgi:predicted nucleic acid-binding protein